ncbi:hypothetical protein Y032_0279g1193 [Ancylostoma ceylanicum]|uniref:Uncharacterized protein n=1 Tax=Ancylostoma ceylanicum TaxID=53326 RepID=A0A016S6Z7_9BILA|nr:hypothetical protein Y032_0279g1193 [Ancylostoma ceylanicum]
MKSVIKPSQTQHVGFVGHCKNSKSLPYVLFANAIELCKSTHPPQHSHLHEADSVSHFIGDRPTFNSERFAKDFPSRAVNGPCTSSRNERAATVMP